MSKPVVVIPEGAHSELGPSSSDRWIQCPGSVLASREIEVRTSDYALEGSAAHAVSQWVRELRVPAETYKGYTLRFNYKDETRDFYCGKSMVESVQEFVDRVGKLPGQELVEHLGHYEEYVPGGFGTSDSKKLNDWICYIGDFKHGKGHIVHAEMNSQLLLYSLSTYLQFRPFYKFDTFDLQIYQPRRQHFDQAEIKLDKLLQWAGDVARPAALRALQPGAPFKAGEWCTFCKLKPECGVHREWKRARRGENDLALIDLS